MTHQEEQDSLHLRSLGLDDAWVDILIPQVSRLRIDHRYEQPNSDFYLQAFGDAHLAAFAIDGCTRPPFVLSNVLSFLQGQIASRIRHQTGSRAADHLQQSGSRSSVPSRKAPADGVAIELPTPQDARPAVATP